MAALERRLIPINEERLRELDALEAEAGTLDLEKVLMAFLGPPLRFAEKCGKGGGWIMQFAGRIHTSPDAKLRSIFMERFKSVRERFIPAIQRAMPGFPDEEIFRRFHLVIGAMVHTMVSSSMVSGQQPAYRDAGLEDIETVLDRLVRFAAAGLRAPLSPSNKGGAALKEGEVQ